LELGKSVTDTPREQTGRYQPRLPLTIFLPPVRKNGLTLTGIQIPHLSMPSITLP